MIEQPSEQQIERCPRHPDVTPVCVVVRATHSAQSDYPTRLVQEPRCPDCP